jgi:hypothetical protein
MFHTTLHVSLLHTNQPQCMHITHLRVVVLCVAAPADPMQNLMGQFGSAQLRFFRQLCTAAKVSVTRGWGSVLPVRGSCTAGSLSTVFITRSHCRA